MYSAVPEGTSLDTSRLQGRAPGCHWYHPRYALGIFRYPQVSPIYPHIFAIYPSHIQTYHHHIPIYPPYIFQLSPRYSPYISSYSRIRVTKTFFLSLLKLLELRFGEKTCELRNISNCYKLHKSQISSKCFLFLPFNRCYRLFPWHFNDISMIFPWNIHDLLDIFYSICILYMNNS